MKPYHSIIVLLVIVCSAVAAGRHGYICTRDDIVADMNQALEQTLARKQEGWITPDTIADYRSHLKIAGLRQTSMVCYAMVARQDGLQSRAMTWHDGKGRKLAFQGFANMSAATVFAMSDQRPTMLLSIAAMLWAAFSAACFRRRHQGMMVLGGLMMDSTSRRFLTLKKDAVTFTPMQERLLQMFFAAESHRLAKQQICDALWPGKPDASDTLYTLVRRMRPLLADKGLAIRASRGKGYELTTV